MRPLSTFALEIQRGETRAVACLCRALAAALDVDGVLRLTPSAFRLAGLRLPPGERRLWL